MVWGSPSQLENNNNNNKKIIFQVGPPEAVEAELCLVPQNPIYQLYATIVAFYLPLTVILILNTQIYRIARKIINRVGHSRIIAVTRAGIFTPPGEEESLSLSSLPGHKFHC